MYPARTQTHASCTCANENPANDDIFSPLRSGAYIHTDRQDMLSYLRPANIHVHMQTYMYIHAHSITHTCRNANMSPHTYIRTYLHAGRQAGRQSERRACIHADMKTYSGLLSYFCKYAHCTRACMSTWSLTLDGPDALRRRRRRRGGGGLAS